MNTKHKIMRMFVDANNFHSITNELFGEKTKVDLYKLFLDVRDYFQEHHYKCYFDKAYYYSALSIREDNPALYDEHKRFLAFIEKIPFIKVVCGFLAKRPYHKNIPINIEDSSTYFHIEKETDVNLSNEMLESAFKKEYDVGLLFAADGDYSDTLVRLREYPVEIYVVLPEGAPSSRLQSVVGKNKIIRLPKEFFKVLNKPNEIVKFEVQNNDECKEKEHISTSHENGS